VICSVANCYLGGMHCINLISLKPVFCGQDPNVTILEVSKLAGVLGRNCVYRDSGQCPVARDSGAGEQPSAIDYNAQRNMLAGLRVNQTYILGGWWRPSTYSTLFFS